MHIEFIIEDYSGGEALKEFLPQCLASGTEDRVHNFSGKQDLLKKLPARLKGYKDWIPDDWLIIVLIDRDDEDCIQLKQELEDIASKAGFITKANDIAKYMNPVVNRSKSFQAFYEGLKTWQDRH